MADIDKLIALGEKLGLTGKDLLGYVQDLREEEKKKQEAEEEKERRKKDEEDRRRVEEYEREEKRKQADFEREERRAAREKEKLELELQLKIEENRGNGEREMTARVASKAPKLPAFADSKDDLDSYLGRFERYAVAQKWKKEDWAVNLSALLTGRALETYYRLPEAEASKYDKLKSALLNRYQLTEDGFREKFFSSRADLGETANQYLARIENYLDRWIQLSETEKSFESLKNLFLREQFINSTHKDLSMFLRERKMRRLEEVIKTANNYQEAHGGHLSSHSGVQKQDQKKTEEHRQENKPGQSYYDRRMCYHCHRKGHIASKCPQKDESPAPRPQRICFLCNRRGHIARDCRNQKAACMQMVSDEQEEEIHSTRCPCCTQRKSCSCDGESEHASSFTDIAEVDIDFREKEIELEDGHAHKICHLVCRCPLPVCSCNKLPTSKGYLNGFQATTMRDSGCSGIVVRAEYVHSKQYTGKNKLCLMIDGTARNVPLAKVDIDSPYFKGQAEAMVMPLPVYDLIIGNVPGAREPNDPDKSWTYAPQREEAYAVVTRHQSREQQRKKTIKPLPVPEQSDFQPSKLKSLAQEQKEDSSLQSTFLKAQNKETPRTTKASMTWFEVNHGVLYRMFKKIHHPLDPVIKQIVVPKKRRAVIMKLAHESLMAGHMGIQRTLDRIMTNFYWPGIHSEVTRFCRSCDICQRTTPKGRIQKATLEQMPLIDTPFKRVAVDLVGPITPRSKQGNKYILTLVDYATRYPEAKALPNIETETVAEALLEIYSRVGFPEEMLTDLGTQFTSDVMREVSRLISLKQLVTTPYHPMCNGLCERMNGTLKTILKRLCAEKPDDWDRYLSATLFAYREVPQESLGFSPFEMIYGHPVRGPMDILKTLWTKEVDDPSIETSYTYVTQLKERLEETCKIAQEELSKASNRFKKFYNRKARDRRLVPGERALLLLPTAHNKLLMQWRGPFKVLEKVNKHDYRIDVNGKPRLFHINMLKPYTERESTVKPDVTAANKESVFEYVSLAVVEEEDCEEDGEDLLQTQSCGTRETYLDVTYSEDLTEEQLKQAKDLVHEFRDIFTDLPGSTDLAEHTIKLTTDEPIRQRPYPLPYAVRETVKEEVQQMLDMGVIEHTTSPYSSPIVLVKKKDGSNRFCVDFRKLNRVTVFDTEPMPSIEDIFAKLKDDCFFSKIDLAKGYWQIPVQKEDRQKTAFITPDGSYQFRRMPFGLVNSTATFNRMMRRAMQGVQNADTFVDDLLGHNQNWDEHLVTLRDIFESLRSAHLTARPSKCCIGFQNLEFVGHQLGQGLIKPNPDKVEDIMKAEEPKTKKQVRSFLGLVGYYREYIPNFAAIAVPLTDLTRKGQPNIVEWSDAQDIAFRTLKKCISSNPILQMPDFSKMFILQTDASEDGLGAALTQEFAGKHHPVMYASKKLLPREKKYSTIERECLALVWAIRKFMTYLYGREFVVQTDHQPLVYINHAKYSNNRVMRWALFLQNFRFRVIAVAGKDNVLADYLSRMQ